MLSAHDVARELRRRLPPAGDVKIHKLVYYCQGWHVAWLGRPMFRESIEAWTNGPVVADLWHDEKRNRSRPAQHLEDSHVAVFDYVIGRYGASTARDLVRQTHLEDPWRDASESDDAFVMESPEITLDALRVWFEADEEYLAHRTAVLGLREQRDFYGFEGPPLPDGLREATLRILGNGGTGLAAG